MSTILVVDDSAFQRKVIRSLIGDLAESIVEAASGPAALQAIHSEHFDCVTLDLGLPDMTGFDVLAALKGQVPHPTVVVVSADIQDTSKARCLELGAHAVLNKPVNKDEIRSVISRVLAATPAD